MLLFLLNILIYTINALSVNYPFNLNYCNNNYKNKIIMYYDPIKDQYHNNINIISTFRANILINKWFGELYVNDNKKNHIPKYIYKFIYDMKAFIAINGREKNIIYLTWIPDSEFLEKNIAYIISCKICNNEIQIYRIAQSPIYSNILDVNSYEMVEYIEKLFYDNCFSQYNISYLPLHEYDNRYLLSWNYNKS